MEDKRKRRRPSADGEKRPARKREGKKPEERKPERQSEQERVPAQEVVYTAPEPLDRKKLILRLVTVAAVVLALFIGCSIFFKVDKIVVSGNVKYDAWTVLEASGIQEGESLLTLPKAKACGKITEALPYVKIVRIGITLPGTVNIYIEELNVVYAAQDANDGWWLLTSDGRVVEKTSAANAKDKTILKGFRLSDPKAGEKAKALEVQIKTGDGGQDVPVTITNQDRLNTALSIVTELERRGVLGKVASVDVTDMANIELWYGTDYQVKLGDAGEMEEKLGLMVGTIRLHEKEGSYQSGILDITFEIYPDAVGYEPFN
ncbi:MAG: FtsQ-type POTRA domain-containing protein [Oscillospiraceae bacterium]|nr:FtsQ-type POTRA domain-containing protein [Oscillospiraceae bacterium]